MMVTRADIVSEALSWTGTPFRDHQCMRGVGVDCARLIEGVAKALGLYREFICPAYTLQPDSRMLRRILSEHLDPVPFAELQPGDIVRLRPDIHPQHLAIVTSIEPLRIVHATNHPGTMKVVEVGLDRYLQSRIADCWRYRGIE